MNNQEIKEMGLAGNGGICIDGDIQLKFSSKHSATLYYAFRVMLAFMATFSTAVLANSFTNSGIDTFMLLYDSAIAAIGLSLLLSKHTVIRICSGLVLFMYAVPIIKNLKLVKYGFMAAANGYLTKGNLPDQSTGVVRHYLTSREAVDQSLYYFFTALIFVLALGAVIACIIRIDFPIIFIFTFPILELGLYLGFEVPTYAALMLLVAWVTLLSINIINHTTNKAGRKNTFALHERSRTFYFTSTSNKSEFYTVYMRFVAMITATVFLTIVLFSAATGFHRPGSFEELRYNLHNAMQRFDVLHADDFLIDVNGGSNLFGVTTVGGTNGGILGTTNGISFNGSKALVMNTDSFNYTMYLRGYVAGDYKNNTWQPLEKDRVIQQISDELENIGAWVQDYDYILLGNEGDDVTNSRRATMDISVKGACSKFVYAPYATQYILTYAYDKESGMTPYNDSYVRVSQSHKDYSLSYRNFNDSDWFGRADNLQWSGLSFPDDIRPTMELYEKYVYDNYTEAVELDSLDEVYREICADYLDGDPEMYSYSYICKAIKNYLSDKKFTYDLNPDKTPDDRDFIDYFLTEQKTGYCTYYATVGAQLMRKFGYPARYVEGYMVLPTQLNNSPMKNGKYEVTVKDKCAHAWTEVFIDGVGWMPAEFTPGYDNDNPNLTNEEKGQEKKEESSSAESSSKKSEDISSSSKKSGGSDNSRSAESKSDSRSQSKATGGNNSSVGGGHNSGKEDSDSNSAAGVHTPGGKGDGGTTHVKKAMSPMGKTVCMTMFAILVSAAAVVLNRRRCLNKMHDSCTQSDLNKRVLAMYSYSLKYLSVLNIEVKKNISDMQMCSELLKQCHEQRIHELDEKLVDLTVIAVKAHMNPGSITEDEAAEAEEVLRCISDEVVAAKLGVITRLSAKYLYCLY